MTKIAGFRSDGKSTRIRRLKYPDPDPMAKLPESGSDVQNARIRIRNSDPRGDGGYLWVD